MRLDPPLLDRLARFRLGLGLPFCPPLLGPEASGCGRSTDDKPGHDKLDARADHE